MGRKRNNRKRRVVPLHDPDTVQDQAPAPSEVAARNIDGEAPESYATRLRRALVEAAYGIGEFCRPLGMAVFDEISTFDALDNAARRFYRPPSIRALAKRAGIPKSTAAQAVARFRIEAAKHAALDPSPPGSGSVKNRKGPGRKRRGGALRSTNAVSSKKKH